jgi:hypothetical protein
LASRERDTLLREALMALVVGTVLAFINDGQALVAGRFTSDQLLPMLMTYLVPFSVSQGEVGGMETPA